MTCFADEIELRNKIAGKYSESLGQKVQVPDIKEGKVSAWAQYTIQYKDRDGMAKKMKKEGIPTAIYYPKPLHQQAAYRNYMLSGQSLEVSERLSAEVLSLPMHPYLSEQTQNYIISQILDY